MMITARSREERDRYIAKNLGADGRLTEGLSPRTFVSHTADTTVLSYPKSGKTWLSYMVTAYIADYLNCPPKTAQHVGKKGILRTLSPEVQERYVGAVTLNRSAERWAPLISFGHQDSLGVPFYLLRPIQPPSTDRTIILLRDPRDIVVSHFHHVVIKNKGGFSLRGTEAILPADYEVGEFIRSDYFGIRHVIAYAERWGAWAAETGAPVFYYEDFVTEPDATLHEFLLAAGVTAIEPKKLRRSIQNAEFDRMANAEAKLHEKLGVEGSVPERRRMRKGKVGGYLEDVTPDDAAYMARVMERASIPALKRYAR